jgi:hypothetical protein
MSKIYFAQIQHPVGQGGFHTGWLFDPDFPMHLGLPVVGHISFAWAYDCGSDQRSVLTTQIQKVRGARLNVLFLSHLDSDHVVGVDELLLAASSVDEVVLPYLGDDGWALHLAAAAADGALSGSFVDLAADPAGWFGARGVRRITYVEASEEDGEPFDGPDPIGPTDPDRGRETAELVEDVPVPMKIGWSRSPRVLDSAAQSGTRAEVVIVPRGAVAAVLAPNRTLNWVLSPFAFRPSAAKMLKFKAKLASELGAGLTAKEYAAAARTDPGRAKLRACYDEIWTTHNLHSMALYAGPAVASLGKLRNTAWHRNFLRRVVQPGWVSTGDFDTTVKKRRDALLRYYAPYADMVGQLALPHHGSDLSFDASILAAFSDLTFAIAAVGANGHGHPGLGVQAAVAAIPAIGFVRVDEGPSNFYEIVGPV